MPQYLQTKHVPFTNIEERPKRPEARKVRNPNSNYIKIILINFMYRGIR